MKYFRSAFNWNDLFGVTSGTGNFIKNFCKFIAPDAVSNGVLSYGGLLRKTTGIGGRPDLCADRHPVRGGYDSGLFLPDLPPGFRCRKATILPIFTFRFGLLVLLGYFCTVKLDFKDDYSFKFRGTVRKTGSF